jgi:Fe2+ transport system protein FeoA
VQLPVLQTIESVDAPLLDLRLIDIELDQVVELVSLEMSEDQMLPLLELGVLPGCHLCPVRHSPSGDPIVMVDGTMLALRRSVADCLCVKFNHDDPTAA